MLLPPALLLCMLAAVDLWFVWDIVIALAVFLLIRNITASVISRVVMRYTGCTDPFLAALSNG